MTEREDPELDKSKVMLSRVQSIQYKYFIAKISEIFSYSMTVNLSSNAVCALSPLGKERIVRINILIFSKLCIIFYENCS